MKRIDEYEWGMIMGFTIAYMHHILCKWSNGDLAAEEAWDQTSKLSDDMLYAQIGEGKGFNELMAKVRAECQMLKSELMQATK